VLVIRCRQAVRQTIAAKTSILCLSLKRMFPAAMPFACSDTPHVLSAPLHFAVCHTACSSCVLHSPSLNRSFTFISLHLVRCSSFATLPCILINTQIHTQKDALTTSQAIACSPGSITLIPSGFVQYCSVHPLPHFCSPAAPPGSVHSVLLIDLFVPHIHKGAHQFTCIRQPLTYPSGNLLQRLPM
jgi:hypothetical protein